MEDLEDEDVRSLERDQLAAFLAVVNPTHRTLFKLLAATGLRISEVLAFAVASRAARQLRCQIAAVAVDAVQET